MGMPQLVVMAVLVEGRTKSEVAREYGVSRRWVITLVQRYLAEGHAGLQPRPRRPFHSPNRTAPSPTSHNLPLADAEAVVRSDTAATACRLKPRSRFRQTTVALVTAPRRWRMPMPIVSSAVRNAGGRFSTPRRSGFASLVLSSTRCQRIGG